MRKLLTYLLLLFPFLMQAEILAPIHWEACAARLTDSTAQITLTATIDEGWHLYTQDLPEGGPVATQFRYKQPVLGPTTTDAPVLSDYDENFEMELTYYTSRVVFTQTVLARPDETLAGSVTFMACDDHQCLAPETWDFEIGKVSPEETNSPREAIVRASASKELSTLLWIFLMGLLGGLLAIFTPCVWPIIPMTVSFFLKRAGASSGQTAGKGIRDAVLYGLAIIIIYVGLGLLITVIFGASALNALSTNAVVNLIFFALLLLFAAIIRLLP